MLSEDNSDPKQTQEDVGLQISDEPLHVLETPDPTIVQRDSETRSTLAQILTYIFAGTILAAFGLTGWLFWPLRSPSLPATVTLPSPPHSNASGIAGDPIKIAQAEAKAYTDEVAAHTDESVKLFGVLKDLLTVLLPAETGLLGAAFGFYFGVKTAEQQK